MQVREKLHRLAEMRELFTTPLLPYKEYIVDHGRHGVNIGKDHPHYFADYTFTDQGIKVSLIHGPLFYCDVDHPYEWRVGDLSGDWNTEVSGFRTEEELYILLTKIVTGCYVLIPKEVRD
jgi:hypothetical protein